MVPYKPQTYDINHHKDTIRTSASLHISTFRATEERLLPCYGVNEIFLVASKRGGRYPTSMGTHSHRVGILYDKSYEVRLHFPLFDLLTRIRILELESQPTNVSLCVNVYLSISILNGPQDILLLCMVDIKPKGLSGTHVKPTFCKLVPYACYIEEIIFAFNE